MCCAAEKQLCQQHKSSPAVRCRARTPKPAEQDATAEYLRCLLNAAARLNECTLSSEVVNIKCNSQLEAIHSRVTVFSCKQSCCLASWKQRCKKKNIYLLYFTSIAYCTIDDIAVVRTNNDFKDVK